MDEGADLRAAAMRRVDHAVPLVVDLDGTLVFSDLLLESIFILAKERPLDLLRLPFWLAQGRAQLKQRLARLVRPEAPTLPYNRPLIDYLRAEKGRGRRLILATAADAAVACEIADEVGLFDAVYASDGVTNLIGTCKRKRLVAEFGIGGFDYAGNDSRDLPVWSAARKAMLVQPSRALHETVSEAYEVERVFEQEGTEGSLRRALRMEHWFKNVLVFLPILAAHRLYEVSALLHGLAAFVAFCLCASSVYLTNDLLDLPNDRRHPYKKERPLASGRLPISRALIAIPLLLVGAVGASLANPPAMLGILGAYWVLMLAYCLRFRDIAVIDVLVLAGGYALRVMAGSAAIGLEAVPWLVVISCVLFFFGLALLKRYAELVAMRSLAGPKARARGYLARFLGPLALIGCASGYLAVAIYAYQVDIDHKINPRYGLDWVICVLLLYWVTHIWLIVRRGQVVDDPVAFTLTDRASQIVAAVAAVIVLIST